MQTRQMLYALGLASLGVTAVPLSAARPAVAAPETKNQVTGVTITSEAGLTRIAIAGTQPFTPEIRNLRRPSATIVTIPGQWKAGRSGLRRVGRNGVAFIRCGQFSRAPQSTVRLVANNRRRLDFEALPSPDRTRWEIVLKEPGVVFASQVASPAQGAIPVVAPLAPTPAPVGKGIAPVVVQIPANPSAPRSIVPSGTPAATANPVAGIASVGAVAVTAALPPTALPVASAAPLLASAVRPTAAASTATRRAAPSLLTAAGLLPQPRIAPPALRLRPRRTSRATTAPHPLLVPEPLWRAPDEAEEAPAAPVAIAAAPVAVAPLEAQPAPEPLTAPAEPGVLAEGPEVVPDASLQALAATQAPDLPLAAAQMPVRDTLPALPNLPAPQVVASAARLKAPPALTLQATKPPAAPSKPAAAAPPKETRPAPPPARPAEAPPAKETRPAPPAPPRESPALVATTPNGLRTLSLAPAGSAADDNVPDVTKRLISSLDFNNADITDVLKAIAVMTGVNIISGDDVKDKKVTLTLRKVPLIDALDWVAKLSGFRYALINNTFVVGTGANLTALSRRPSVSEAVSIAVPFFYSDVTTLVGSVMMAFPNANVSAVGVSAESKLVDSGVQNNQSTSTQSGNTSSSGSTSSTSTATVKLTPRGGVLNVVGTLDEVERIRQFVEETERSLVLSAQREAEYNSKRMAGFTTETYTIKYSAVADLISLMHRMAPTVDVYPGPTPNFVAVPSGSSASFGGSGTTGPGAAAAGGGQSGGAQSALAPTTLILTGPPADVSRALATLDKLDIKQPQLIFEAKLVEVNTSDMSQLGVTYDVTRPITVGEKNFGEGPIGPETGSSTGRKPEMGAIYRTPYSIGMGLQALVQNNRAKILASPNMMALNNNLATTFIGDQLKYVINVQQTPVGPAIQTETASVGITLKAVGRAKPDNTIELYVHPEVSVISRFINVAGTAISLPQIATRFTDSTVRVKDGETIAIGGLLREQDIANLQKVPVLGDLPVLGQLFRSNDKRKERTELMIFITCRLAKD